jgi:hypothetical protein
MNATTEKKLRALLKKHSKAVSMKKDADADRAAIEEEIKEIVVKHEATLFPKGGTGTYHLEGHKVAVNLSTVADFPKESEKCSAAFDKLKEIAPEALKTTAVVGKLSSLNENPHFKEVFSSLGIGFRQEKNMRITHTADKD